MKILFQIAVLGLLTQMDKQSRLAITRACYCTKEVQSATIDFLPTQVTQFVGYLGFLVVFIAGQAGTNGPCKAA